MEMLEGNVFVVSNKQYTIEFQPSADMSWANNELSQAVTYPYASPYVNESKGNMCTMGASIGMGEEDFFKSYTLEVRNSHVKKVNEFMISLPSSMSGKDCHSRKLQFMAENGICHASAVERRADQGNGNENRKLQVYVPHDDDAGEQSTRVDFNASNQKFLCDLGNALSSYHKEDFDVNVTVWTVGYAMPYHATKSYESCKVGYGIISLQKKRLNTQGKFHFSTIAPEQNCYVTKYLPRNEDDNWAYQ
ncbi:unnamed protein product [Pocillopora meandrina]|uniref:Uncharacterized protein n=1 Tax=Pocillopora meandrina TaxID=46732 RepID=A0AAU9VM48_9CNID|nr:unnamed protein product [Pocillopora meandrina]